MRPDLNVDILHVISDLHLGGDERSRIFRCGLEFERLSNALYAEAESATVGLVINGDFVDFLAEKEAECFDVANAETKLCRILKDQSFAQVTHGLQQLLAHPRVSVALNLGNHDLELALPWVAWRLADMLAGSDPAKRGRLLFKFDGTGIRCAVGGATILCVHGNEVDNWNITDHEAIRKIVRNVARGVAVDPWVPNAGTQLVITALNEVKQRFPFVDVLKPETKAVLPILFALDERLARKAVEAIKTLPRLAISDARLRAGWLDDSDRDVADKTDDALSNLEFSYRAMNAEAMLEEAEQRFQAGERPLDALNGDRRKYELGVVSAGWALLSRQPKIEALRRALEALDGDQSFDPSFRDATFHKIDDMVSPSIDFVVAGHTHLRRAISRRSGQGYYYNTGTWAALMQIPAATRQNTEEFSKLIAALEGNDVAELEGKSYILREPTVASFWKEGLHVHGELRRATSFGPAFMSIKGTHKVKV